MNSSHDHKTRFWNLLAVPFKIVDDHSATFIWELHPGDEISSLKITDSFQFTIRHDNTGFYVLESLFYSDFILM